MPPPNDNPGPKDRGPAKALMVQGTGSDVGKSLVVAGLCRLFANQGRAVRPFKPQNMSNNAAVVPASDGGGETPGEIGRAQALQAKAAKQPLSVHMNPVLLKPQTDIGAQVVVQGRVRGNAKARDYHALKPELLAAVRDSFAIVRDGVDLVLVEGAGSPAEVNLRAGDIANMGFALDAQVPVVLVADIGRGGVIASLVGTWEVLPEEERALIRGYVINKFRGDVSLFDDAIGIIKDRTGMNCLGVVPHFPDARLLPAEDAVALDGLSADASKKACLRVAVPRLPRIANFDDLDPLRGEDGVKVLIVEPGDAIPGDADVILLPGSKATLGDLAVLRAEGWDIDILAHHRRGGLIVGLCGGYQMLGRTLADPGGVEGPPAIVEGLGLLAVDTVIGQAKTLRPATGTDTVHGEAIAGYEMHMGETTGPGLARPWLDLASGPDGALSDDGRVMGAYVHGLFAADGFRRAFLSVIRGGAYAQASYETRVEETLDRLADHLESHLDMTALAAAFA